MRIGIVLSGGDGVGINNFVYQIARLSQADIVIYNGGINGLLLDKKIEMSFRDLADFSTSSMPIISSGRTSRMLIEDEYVTIATRLKRAKIDVLVLAGGDGSLQFLDKLSRYDVNCFGVGMTVDNDISGSEYTIGFSTACQQVLNEVVKLRQTGRALPNRIFMIEVLGAYSGELTLQSAIKSNADLALIPENQLTIEEIAHRINEKLTLQNSVIVLCSESYTKEYMSGFQGAINTLASQIEPLLNGNHIRKTMLGFGLRSGELTTEEIYQGTILANEIVRCIDSNMRNKVIVVNASNKAIPIDLGSMSSRIVDTEGHYFQLAKRLGII
ncbi:TPA: 6-phosphofructokinase [Vibrio parahaemolyticus]